MYDLCLEVVTVDGAWVEPVWELWQPSKSPNITAVGTIFNDSIMMPFDSNQTPPLSKHAIIYAASKVRLNKDNFVLVILLTFWEVVLLSYDVIFVLYCNS